MAVVFITSNILTVFLVVVLYFLRGFTFDETTTTVAIVAPVFAAYASGIIRFSVKHRDAKTQPHRDAPQTFVFSFISTFVPVMFVVAIVGLVVLRAANFGITSFEQFKILLGIAEALFAGYAALLVGALFGTDAVAPRDESPTLAPASRKPPTGHTSD